MKTFAIVALLVHMTFAQSNICQNQQDHTLLPNHDSCSLYFECIGNQAFLLSCPNGFVFNQVINRCDSNAVCDETTTGTVAPPPGVTCDGVPNFRLIPSPNACERYYQCIYGNAFLVVCPFGLHFDAVRQTCSNPEDANCALNTSPLPSPTPPGPTVSCVGVPNFRYLPSPQSCELYYQCIDGEAYRLSCPIGLQFDEGRQTCDDPINVNCELSPRPSPSPTPPGPTVSCVGVPNFRYLPSPQSCELYYQCIDGEAYRLSCPIGLQFDEGRQTCDDPINVNCELSPRPSPTPPGPTVSCDGVPNLRFIPSPVACHEFFQCVNDFAFRLSCPQGLYFNELIQTCDNPANVDCTTVPTMPPGPPSPISCEGVPDFRSIPHPNSCSLFFQCINGNPFLLSCSRGLYFNEAIQTCDDPSNVDCLTPTTTVPTTIPPTGSPKCVGIEEGTFVPNPFSCLSYYQCIDGFAMPRFCDDGLWFDPPSQRCTEPANADCGAATIPTVPTAPDHECDQIDEGYVGSLTYCHRYYYCVRGVAFPQECPDGQWFDRVNFICDAEENLECDLYTRATTEATTITTRDPSPEAICRDITNNTFVRNPMACEEFFHCINEEPHGRFCNQGLWFNFIQQRCTDPYEARCELDSWICDGVPNNRMIRSMTSCSDFVICTDGHPIPQACYGITWFDEENQICTYPDDIECDLVTTRGPPRSVCDGQREFWLARSADSCSEFFVCINNEPRFPQTCPDGQFFDENLQSCDENATCDI